MRYSIILADCPWSYRDKNNNGNRGAVHKYSVLTVADLKKLSVGRFCASQCVLFLWATAPMIPEALEVMNAWGFKFKTVAFTWIKKNKKSDGFFKGLGHYTRGNAEYVLLGTKGKSLERMNKGVSSLIITPRGGHSQKPIEVQQAIRRLYGPLPGLELFARERSPYFETLGDELDGKDIREVLR